MQVLSEVTIKSLLESGAHFGHQKHRWNPKMKRFIFEERNGLYIIDLAKTLQQIRSATEVVKSVVADKRSVLFVGTKKQAKVVIKDFAENCGEFYVCERWLGGMLTNLKTIRESVKRLDRIEKKLIADSERMTKKEFSMLSKTQQKLERNLSGIRSMRKPPGLVIVVDPNREQIAVAEARKLGIPVMALVDTNCDPDLVDYVIACNDDALKCVKLIIQSIATAILEKKKELGLLKPKKEEGPVALEEKKNPVVEANKEPDESGDQG